MNFVKSWPVLAIFSAFIAVALFLVYLFGTGGGRVVERAMERSAPVVTTEQQRANAVQAEELKRREAALQAEQVRSAVRLDEAVYLGEAALAMVTEATDEFSRWEKEVTPLLSNNDGKALAGDEGALAQFSATYDKERPKRAELDALRGRVETLLAAVRKARDEKQVGFDAKSTVRGDIEAESAAAKRIRDSYRDGRREIEVLLESARTRSAPSEMTLEETIRTRKAVFAKEHADTVLAAEKEARAEAAEIEAATQKDVIAQKAETDRVAALAAADAATSIASATGERAKWEKLAEDPAIQAKFQPFLASGVKFPGISGRYKRPGPVAYADLGRLRILSDVETMVKRGCGPNDRPSWPCPKTEEQWKEYEERFVLLQNLAPIWHEKGLLR